VTRTASEFTAGSKTAGQRCSSATTARKVGSVSDLSSTISCSRWSESFQARPPLRAKSVTSGST